MSARREEIVENARECIRREARALAHLAETIDDDFADVVAEVSACSGKVVTTGAGTSGIMAERLAHLLAVAGTPAFYLPSQDALHGGMGAVTPGDYVIAFSKGGRSAELTQLVSRLVERGVAVTAVTESPDSPFAEAATRTVVVTTDPAEADLGGLIATGSTLVAGAWGDALTGTLMALSGFSWEEVVRIHPAGIVGEQSDLPEAMSLDGGAPGAPGAPESAGGAPGAPGSAAGAGAER
ncbi:SIS domain-containing protein [Leucobacter sp. CSA1]|uniref:SIS domain-containing protein n=1 Tax=Leucobacter chromiisoli TaxID=2796471 RepID=A0A934Q4L4_9MICO|nr:SIS domain-containing protein [Leucobacter chromiisoli]MBK0417446.1 SIS domain-containing protein [Leucobacter chromiisoli]